MLRCYVLNRFVYVLSFEVESLQYVHHRVQMQSFWRLDGGNSIHCCTITHILVSKQIRAPNALLLKLRKMFEWTQTLQSKCAIDIRKSTNPPKKNEKKD